MGCNQAERYALQAAIAKRRPFLDFPFSRAIPDRTRQQVRVGGEPMFNRACRYVDYRGIGAVVIARP